MRRLPKSIDPVRIEWAFEACWERMIEDLRKPRTLVTTGGKTTFRVWSEGDSLKYEKTTGKRCLFSKSDILKAYLIFKNTGSLMSDDYRETRHGSYLPPLLFEYFLKAYA